MPDEEYIKVAYESMYGERFRTVIGE